MAESLLGVAAHLILRQLKIEYPNSIAVVERASNSGGMRQWQWRIAG